MQSKIENAHKKPHLQTTLRESIYMGPFCIKVRNGTGTIID